MQIYTEDFPSEKNSKLLLSKFYEYICSISNPSMTTFTDLGGRVYTTESSQKSHL